MESRFGGFSVDSADMSFQEPMRGSATPGWKAANNKSNTKVRIDPPKPIVMSLTNFDNRFRDAILV
jgi:hypothetical protein